MLAVLHVATLWLTARHTNEFRSTLAGVTVEGRAHSLSAWFVFALRLVIFAFLYSGVEKNLGSFDARGYLANVAATDGTPLEGLFLWMS